MYICDKCLLDRRWVSGEMQLSSGHRSLLLFRETVWWWLPFKCWLFHTSFYVPSIEVLFGKISAYFCLKMIARGITQSNNGIRWDQLNVNLRGSRACLTCRERSAVVGMPRAREVESLKQSLAFVAVPEGYVGFEGKMKDFREVKSKKSIHQGKTWCEHFRGVKE